MKDIQWLLSTPVAHRGLHNAELPENSIGAFENAIEHGFPIEMDLHITDDGELVVFHDSSLARMTGKDGFIENSSSAMLKELRLVNGEKKPTEFSIPTFEEFLSCVDGKVPLLIEIKSKSGVGALEEKTISLLKDYNGKYALQSFNPFSIEYFKNKLPDAPRGILSCFFTKADLKGRFKRYLLKTLHFNKLAKPDFVSYKAENLPNKYVNRSKLPVLAWTVRSNEMRTALNGIANNIIFENFIPEK